MSTLKRWTGTEWEYVGPSPSGASAPVIWSGKTAQANVTKINAGTYLALTEHIPATGIAINGGDPTLLDIPTDQGTAGDWYLITLYCSNGGTDQPIQFEIGGNIAPPGVGGGQFFHGMGAADSQGPYLEVVSGLAVLDGNPASIKFRVTASDNNVTTGFADLALRVQRLGPATSA